MPGRAKIANNDKTRLLEIYNNGDDYVELARHRESPEIQRGQLFA